MKKIIFTVFCIVGLLRMDAADTLSWLHTRDNLIVDESENTVVLRGINIGGWLVQEMWMMPFKTTSHSHSTEIVDYLTLWSVFEERFGKDETQNIKNYLRRSWFQESDFDRIQALGLNCIRLPFIFDLEDETDGLFSWLDWAIAQAEKRALYVILDMHGAPGRQSVEQHTGQVDHNRLFYHAPDVQKTKDLWQKIALRYKDSATVAGYDLLNEPMGAPNTEALYDMYEDLYQSIREVDARHMIFFEDGYKGVDNLSARQYAKMENIVLSVHVYKANAKNEEEHLIRLREILDQVHEFQKDCNIPFYLGEFNVLPYGTPETVGKYVQILEEQSMSWSPWTFKVANGWVNNSLWGIYTPRKSSKQINPFHDSKEDIYKKIKLLKSEFFVLNEKLAEAFKGEHVL